jgi:hypothetical protein
MQGKARSGRPSGLPKTGGRQLGTPNKSTLELREKLAQLGCDPLAGLVEIATDPKTPPSCKLQAYAILMPYTYSRLGIAPTQSDGTTRERIDISPEEALNIAQELIKLLSNSVSNKPDEPVEANRRDQANKSESDTSALEIP